MEAEIDKQIHQFEPAVALWQSIPGVDRVTACHLVAEIGVVRWAGGGCTYLDISGLNEVTPTLQM